MVNRNEKTGAVKVPVFFMAAKTLFHIIDSTSKVVSNSKKEIETKYTQRKGNFMETKSFATRAEWKLSLIHISEPTRH